MKKQAGMPILFVVTALCLLFGLICFFFLPGNATETEETEKEGFVCEISLKDAAGISIQNASGGVALMIDENTVSCLNDLNGKILSDTAAKATLYRLTHIPIVRDLGLRDNLADFGLTEPQAKLSITLNNGSTKRIFLGDVCPFGEGFYAEREEDGEVFVISDTDARMMCQAAEDLCQNGVFPPFKADASPADLTYFRLEFGEEIFAFTGVTDSRGTRFTLTEPFEAALDWDRVSEKIFLPFIGTDSVRFVPDPCSLSEWESGIKVTAALGGEVYSLRFVKGDENCYFVKRETGDQVLKVRSEDVSYLTVHASELLSHTLYTCAAADISKVFVKGESIDTAFRFSGAGESLCAETETGKLSGSEALKLVETLTMLSSAGRLTEDAEVTEKPILTLIFFLRDGSENKVEIREVSPRHCAVSIDDRVGPVTYTSTVKEMIRELKTYLL